MNNAFDSLNNFRLFALRQTAQQQTFSEELQRGNSIGNSAVKLNSHVGCRHGQTFHALDKSIEHINLEELQQIEAYLNSSLRWTSWYLGKQKEGVPPLTPPTALIQLMEKLQVRKSCCISVTLHVTYTHRRFANSAPLALRRLWHSRSR